MSKKTSLDARCAVIATPGLGSAEGGLPAAAATARAAAARATARRGAGQRQMLILRSPGEHPLMRRAAVFDYGRDAKLHTQAPSLDRTQSRAGDDSEGYGRL